MPNQRPETKRLGDIYLRVVQSRDLGRCRMVVFYRANVYLNAFVAALAAFGLALPGQAVFERIRSANNQAPLTEQSLLQLIDPTNGFNWIAVALLLYVLFRVYMSVEEIDKKATLALSFAKQMREVEGVLDQACDSSDAMANLNKVHDEKVRQSYNHIYVEGAYPTGPRRERTSSAPGPSRWLTA